MKRILLAIFGTSLISLVPFLSASGIETAQNQVQPSGVVNVVGDVIDVDRTAKAATIKTTQGANFVVKLNDQTVCLRVPAGEKTLEKAVTIHFDDIAAGDRVLVRGEMSEDKKEIAAQRVVVLSKVEIQKRRQHDLQEWRRRGIAGIVKDLNPQTGEINLELRGAGAASRVVITTVKCDFRRYAPGSIKFEDAKASSFAELKSGDQLRALGDKSADGRGFKAEEIVSGAFKTIGALVTEVDLQDNEIKATTLDQKKPIVISIAKDSALHRIPPPLASLIAQKAMAGKPGNPSPAPSPAAGAQKVAATPATNQSPDIQQMIDALPNLNLADIKAGDVVAVTSTTESDQARVTAIKLVAGVDAVLKALAPPPGKPQVVRLSAGLPTAFDFSVIQ
jgi:hypothetical protein